VHTQRLVASEELIVVGAGGMYEARCRRCCEPQLAHEKIQEQTETKLEDQKEKSRNTADTAQARAAMH
jgi:thymidine kinase